MTIHFLTLGTVLGLSAGLAPGPLLTLVVSETLRHGIRSGIKVALAPTITDAPIVLLTLVVLSKLSDFHRILGGISLVGGAFVLLMAYDTFRAKGVEIDGKTTAPRSLAKGILANVLSPHPYLFWLGVGAPIVAKAMTLNLGAPLAFIVSFYVSLVGSKILVATLVGKSRSFLKGPIYLFTMRALGLALGILALALFYDGLTALKVL